MYNPDFWEVRLDPQDLDRYPNEAAAWFESSEENQRRLRRECHAEQLIRVIMEMIGASLTERQRHVVLLYYTHEKTQEEIAQILGISRRVVSQHLFGIFRNGRRVGGAIGKIRKLCRRHGLSQSASGPG